MPQADLLTFQPTLLLLPIIFLIGYFFFVVYWAPRIILTLRSRAYLLSLPIFVPSEQWPEIFLMTIQFIGLIYVLSKLSLINSHYSLPILSQTQPVFLSFESLGGQTLENFFLLWKNHRNFLFYSNSHLELTHLFTKLILTFSYYLPSKQYPYLLSRLQKLLSTISSKSSLPS